MVQPRAKHIEIRYHFSHQAIKSGEAKLIYCPTEIILATNHLMLSLNKDNVLQHYELL